MRTAVTLLVLVCGFARGQAAAAPGAPRNGGSLPALAFPASSPADRRETLARIQETLLFQSQAQQQRLKEANGVHVAMGRLAKTADAESFLLAGMEIQRDLAIALDGLREDRGQCLRILEWIEEASRGGNSSAEVARYLKGARAAATDAMRLQLVQRKRLENTATVLEGRLRQLPPPATFETSSGLAMVLVQGKELSFYISRAPVPPATVAKAFGREEGVPTAVDWHQAARFCQWLTESASAPYALPTLEQMRIFSERGGKVPQPVWTRDLHSPKDLREKNMRRRFGVELVMLFDPDLVLGDRIEREEVPFAAYPEVSFFVVTPAETGWWFRWHALRQKLDD